MAAYTRLNMRDSIRAVLADQNIWKDAALNQWINDAINEYSGYFPYHALVEIDVTAGTQEYDLTVAGAWFIFGVVSAEYPVGEDPPVYLQFKSRLDPAFTLGNYYDLTGDPPETILLGDPYKTDQCNVFISGRHTIPSADSTALTITSQHHDLIRSFVIWRAMAFLETYTAIDPGRKAGMIAAVGKTAATAERFYYYKLKQAQGKAVRSGIAGQWRMDDKDRIY
jgi:hypothetical protein